MKQGLLALGAVLVLAGCTSAQAPPRAEPLTMGDAANGRRLAETYCATCHAIGSGGASPHRDAPAFRTLSRRYSISALEESFGEGVLVGHRDMPEFRMEPAQIDALIAYIYTVQEPRTE